MLVLAAVLTLCVLSAMPSPSPQAGILMPAEWIVVGPFPNEANPAAKPGQADRTGFDKDYLTSLGGEARAKPVVGTPISGYPNATAQSVRPGDQGFVNLTRLYSESSNKVAYAYGVIESDADQEAIVHFGSDDWPKVWVNGQVVHRLWGAGGRAAMPWQDEFSIQLKKGRNEVLLKIDNGAGDWSFYFEAFTLDTHRAQMVKAGVQRLPDMPIVAGGESGFVVDAAFPQLSFKEPSLIAPLMKDVKPRVRWFDESLTEVSTPAKPGLYLGYAEARTEDGQTLKRMVPVYRPHDPSKAGFLAWPPDQALKVSVGLAKGLPIDVETWKSAKPVIDGFGTFTLWRELSQTPSGAVVLWHLESKKGGDPFLNLLDLELALKRKLYGTPDRKVQLVRKEAKPARTLKVGTAVSAGMKPDVVAKLDQLCKDWSKDEGKPFSVVVARRGVAFFQGAYGELNGAKLKKDALFYPASIGKVMCGLVFCMFMEQGLLDPDTPIGKYLPDWPTEGPKAVTFRQCFTHTSGIAGHGTYEGLWNPILDNAFAVGTMANLSPGTRHAYGGDGNNLAAKAMELVAGRSFIRLLQEDLFGPIGAKVDQDDLGWINATTAMDLAKVAQMMLNRGAYGGYRFFSPATFERMLPIKLSTIYPKLDNQDIEWGLCLTPMTDPDYDPVRNPNPRESNALGPNVYGHGSASSSILRVDLDHDLLVVMGRYGVGDAGAYERYRVKFMQALKDALAD